MNINLNFNLPTLFTFRVESDHTPDALTALETRLMAALDGIKAANAADAKRIQDALDGLVTSVTADFKNTADALAALKIQADGNAITPEEVQDVIDINKAATDAIVARISGVDIDPAFPPATPPAP